ncbi:hypothetical protein LDENG_00147750 [Lucifuga dentata]|nr:hypothetical protein LDENG_00147750 [Lucifuga dentata]
MGKIQNFIAIIFLGCLFLILFYSTLKLDTPNLHRPVSDEVPKHTVLQVQDNVVAKQAKQESISTTQPNVLNVSLSDALTKTIPQNGAYWNRLLYSVLRSIDKGEFSVRPDPSWSSCKKTNQEILQTNVHDFTSYPALFKDFVQSMNCRSPPLLIDQPNKCIPGPGEGDDQTFLLFAIKTSPNNFQQRQAVRETWAKEQVYQSGQRVRTVFLLGNSPPDHPDLSLLLSFEAKQFGDLLQWDFSESLLNLTIKANVFLHWTVKNCPHISFIFSGDDDVFINTPALLDYLNSLESSKASQLYAGQIISPASPHRDPNIKYYIPMSFYDGPYPAYAGGGGFIISGALLQPLHYISCVLPLFPIDDVYIGMCMNALGISPEAHKGFQTFDVQQQDRENMCIHKSLFVIHRRSPQQMIKIWNGIHSPFLTC